MRTQTFANGELGFDIRSKLNSLADFEPAYIYNTNDITHYSGSLYISRIDNNLGNIPTSSSLQWTPSTSISASYSLLASHSLLSDSASISNIAFNLETGSNIYLSQSYIISNTAAFAPDPLEGRLWWDRINHTYTIDSLNTRLQIGQDHYTKVIAGENILNGAAVYVSGSDIDPEDPITKIPIAYLAIADGTGLKSNVLGLASSTLNTGNRGFVSSLGTIDNVDTSEFSDGDYLYLSPTDSGSYVNYFPPDPYEKVKLGINLFSNAFIGRILIDVFSSPPLTNAYVGITQVPTFTDNGNHTFTVGEGRGSFCTTADGLGAIKNYSIPPASFSASIGTFGQYVLANYNSGSPYYFTSLNLGDIDEIQIIPVFSFIFPSPSAPVISYKTWDSPGILLANKLHLKTIEVDGTQVASGLMLSTSGSYINITSGSVWYGVAKTFLPAIDTSNTSSSPLTLYYHSASVWQAAITTPNPGHYVDNFYDDGNNLQTLPSGSYVVNYIYRAIGSANRTLITLSDIFTNLSEADIASPPIPPEDFSEFSPLIGRIITQSGSIGPIAVNTIFRVIFPPTSPPQHNDLLDIQGGESNEYYHLTQAEYGTSSNGPFVRANETINSSSLAKSASYILPGATLYVVSSSTNPSYIEPFNIPTVPYTPPYKEGRMFYDKDYSNWVYYTDQNFKLHIGKEVLFQIINPYSVTLPQLSAVYLSGSVGEMVAAYLAQADGTGLHYQAVGVIRYDIPSGSTGYVISAGSLHNVDMTGFNPGDSIFLSDTTPGGFVNVLPGSPSENVRLGYCETGGPSGSFVSQPRVGILSANAYAGMTIEPIVTDNNDGTITISSASVNLFSDPTGLGSVVNYPVDEATFTVITGSANFIVAKYTAGTSASYDIIQDDSIINETTIVPAAILSVVHIGDIHRLILDKDGLALANKLQERLISTERFTIENGFSLGETGSRYVTITGGTIWYGASPHTSPDYDSRNTSSFPIRSDYHFYYHNGSSEFTHSDGFNQYNNSQYDDGTNLQPLSVGFYTVNYIYRIIGASNTSEDVSTFLGTTQYSTIADAVSSTPPSNIPSEITSLGLIVGRIIVQSGSNVAARIDSALGNVFVPTGVTNHENLSGLQGGSPGQHEHLTSAEYVGIGTGVFIRATGSNLTGVIITGNSQLTGSVTSASTALFAITATSASWASQSLQSTYTTNSIFATSASWVSASAKITTADTASYVAGTNVNGTVAFATQATVSTQSLYATQSVNATSASFASSSISSSWVPQQQDISVNSITASFVSASEIQTNDPQYPQDVATKNYVDQINPQGLQAYFRADLDSTTPYYQMHDLSVPLSASAITISTSSVQTNEYIFEFISYGIGVTNINQGNFPVHFHAWFTGFAASLSISPEFWLRNTQSVERLIATEAPITLDKTVDHSYTADITLTASIVTDPSERAIVKFKVASQNLTPTAFMNVDGQTSAGIIIPVPSSNFVLRAGDTMTGPLTASGFYGPLYNTASVAKTASYVSATNISGTVASATQALYATQSLFATSSISASYAGTASVLIGSIQFAQLASSASWVSASNKITTADTASFVTASNVIGVLTAIQVPIAVSASWVSASNKITTADTASFVTASNVIGVLTAIQVPIALSASWVSASNKITTADTASYIVGANVIGSVLFSSQSVFATQSIYATQSNFATSASFASASISASVATTSSYALNALSSSNVLVSSSINVGSHNIVFVNTASTLYHSLRYDNSGALSYDTSTGILSATASQALTASNVTTLYNYVFSGSSDQTTTLATAIATSMSFLVGANQTWECDAHLTIANSSNKGILYAISSSNTGSVTGSIEGWIFGTLAAATFLSQRIVAANALTTTAADTVTTTPGFVQYHFTVNNPTSPATISVAVANQNSGNTITVYRGSYLLARRTI